MTIFELYWQRVKTLGKALRHKRLLRDQRLRGA